MASKITDFPDLAYFYKEASKFCPFLYILQKNGTCVKYIKDNSGHISVSKTYTSMPRNSTPVKLGTLVLLDEFEKQGGCEDDLWR